MSDDKCFDTLQERLRYCGQVAKTQVMRGALNAAADEIDRLGAALAAERERNARLVDLLANIYDNLNDMPVSEEWAYLMCGLLRTALEGK